MVALVAEPVVVKVTEPETSLPLHFWTAILRRLPLMFVATVLVTALQVTSSIFPDGPCLPGGPCGPAGPIRAADSADRRHRDARHARRHHERIRARRGKRRRRRHLR